MALSRSRGFSIRTAGFVISVLGILFGGCKHDGMSRADAAVDGSRGAATASTGTTATSGSGFAAGSGQGGTVGTGSVSSSGASSPSTSPPTTPDAGTKPDVGKAWKTIKLSRSNGLSLCPVAGTAASVVINRGEDGSRPLRCSSVKYDQHSPSSRLAVRAPRPVRARSAV